MDTVDFRYVDLKDVDPNFTLLDPEMYDLRITKAELVTYVSKHDTKTLKTGEEGTYFKFAFTVVDHPKFTGRKIWETLFPSEFSLKILRRIADNTGISQSGSLEDWCKEVTQISPTVKLMVDKVPDTIGKDGVPNPRTQKADGTASDKNVINWRAGVQQSSAV
jgi:hypothetical protein